MSTAAPTTTAGTVVLPGLTAGTWTFDPVHSHVAFSVRHLMVSKVKGSFGTFSGAVTVPESGAPTVTAEIDMTSFDTNNAQRDGHIRSADFLEVEAFPTMTYTSTGLRARGEDFVVESQLTLHGVTRPVELALEYSGVNPGMGAGPVAGFEARTEVNRSDFGVDIKMPLEGGGVVVSEKITITLDIEATLQA